MPPFFTIIYTQWPPIVAFSIKIFQRNQKCVKIAWILCSFAPNDSSFWICHLMSHMTPFYARRLSLLVPWFDASVWAPLSLLYVSAPPRGRDCVPKQWKFQVWSYITTKGPDLKSSLRVFSQISSKHSYLQVPSGNFPLNNRTNLSFEVFLTGVVIYILNSIVRLHQKGFSCFHY